MIEIRGVYEVAIRVHNLERSEKLYCGVLGLEEGLRDESRNWLFLRVGEDAGMVVLQESDDAFPPQHLAFAVTEKEIERASGVLADAGVAVEGPVVHEWIPAKSLYFTDPDGHDLELCSSL